MEDRYDSPLGLDLPRMKQPMFADEVSNFNGGAYFLRTLLMHVLII